PLDIFQSVFDALMNCSPRPHMTVFELLENVYLPSPFWRTFFPATPVSVIVEIVLSGAGFKDLISGFGPGEFVLDSSHWRWWFCISQVLMGG
ncbi:MAG: hypothetical protein V3W19_00125, partial [Desulfatiglandales bacterium]